MIKLRDITFELDQGKDIKPGDAIHKAIKIIKKPEIKKICEYLDSGKHIVSGGDVHKNLSFLVKTMESLDGSNVVVKKAGELAVKATHAAGKAKENADKYKANIETAQSDVDNALKVKKTLK